MANKHASIKHFRKSRKAEKKNLRMKTHIRALTSKFMRLVKEGKKAETTEAARELQQALDKAAKNRLFHPNKSARRLSAIHKLLAKV